MRNPASINHFPPTLFSPNRSPIYGEAHLFSQPASRLVAGNPSLHGQSVYRAIFSACEISRAGLAAPSPGIRIAARPGGLRLPLSCSGERFVTRKTCRGGREPALGPRRRLLGGAGLEFGAVYRPRGTGGCVRRHVCSCGSRSLNRFWPESLAQS